MLKAQAPQWARNVQERSGASLAATLYFPAPQIADGAVPTMCRLFVMVVHAFGLEHLHAVGPFIHRVVNESVWLHDYTWAYCYSYELLLIYLRALDERRVGISMSNIWDSSSQDTFAKNAAKAAVQRWGPEFPFFRTPTGGSQGISSQLQPPPPPPTSKRGTGASQKTPNLALPSTMAAQSTHAPACWLVGRANSITCATTFSKTARSAARLLMVAILVTAPTSASPNSEGAAAFGEFDRLTDLIRRENACALPGVSVKYDSFLNCMWAAVRSGYVRDHHARFVAEGLRWGFSFGVDVAALKGQRVFKNYESTILARDAVSRALQTRVKAGKTLCLGPWSHRLFAYVKERFDNFCIFLMGAVQKALEPGEYRPTSEHSLTGLNAATNLESLRHALTAYKDVAAFLRRGHFMYVSDVEAAFPMLPIRPDLWPFFMCRFFANPGHSHQSLFMHLTGDFGAAGLPGTFKIFLVDVVIQMARYASVLRLPMPVYVDDMALIAPSEDGANDEMAAFQSWASEVCGLVFKFLKDRREARRQLYLGFWWDSISLTRTLEEHKLVNYLTLLDEFARAASLTLRDRRVVAGKMQRAILTLPPGASCLLASTFALMAGLLLPWQRRRTTKEERSDYALLASLLRLNMGRGFYRYDDFQRGRALALSDASKSPGYTGGGYVTRGVRNSYHFYKYGGRASRRSIMVHEGDTALKCGSDNGYFNTCGVVWWLTLVLTIPLWWCGVDGLLQVSGAHILVQTVVRASGTTLLLGQLVLVIFGG